MTKLRISTPRNIHTPLRSSSGFTLLEVIAVLLILAVLGAVALSGPSPSAPYTLAGETDVLKGHLRYAQLRAMNDTVPWLVAVTDTGYTLSQATTPAVLPGEDNATHTFTNGVSVTSGNVTISFDSWGTPGATDISISLSHGTETNTIFVAKKTGFIP